MPAELDSSRRQIRVLTLLDALAHASIFHAPLKVVHEMAYLANVLAPVFDLMPLSASLLKRRNGPFYPELQETIDILVGRGMVTARKIRYVMVEEENRFRLDAEYQLNTLLSEAALLEYRRVFGETGEPIFLRELAQAYSMLSDDELGETFRGDARYADKDVDNNSVIDFGQFEGTEKANFSGNAAMLFRQGEKLEPAERLYMYMEHVQRKVANAR